MSQKARRPDIEFELIQQSGAEDFTHYLETHIKEIASGDPERRDKSVDQLAVQFGNMLAFADLLGRRRMILEGKEIEGKLSEEERLYFQSDFEPLRPIGPPNEYSQRRNYPKTSARTANRLPWSPYDVPGLTTVGFDTALENLATRVPELAIPTAQGIPVYKSVQMLYQTEHAFALAHATHLALANRMEEAMRVTAVTHEALERSLRYGVSGAKFETAMENMQGFTRSYSENVFRTNMSRSYSEGRKRQVETDPTLQYVIPAFEFHNPDDKSSRKNHAACDGIIAAHDSPIWKTLTPPLGYNCRCTLLSVDRYDLIKMKLLNEKTGIVQERVPDRYRRDGGGPDDGFGPSGPGPAPYSGGAPMSLSEAWRSVGE